MSITAHNNALKFRAPNTPTYQSAWFSKLQAEKLQLCLCDNLEPLLHMQATGLSDSITIHSFRVFCIEEIKSENYIALWPALKNHKNQEIENYSPTKKKQQPTHLFPSPLSKVYNRNSRYM